MSPSTSEKAKQDRWVQRRERLISKMEKTKRGLTETYPEWTWWSPGDTQIIGELPPYKINLWVDACEVSLTKKDGDCDLSIRKRFRIDEEGVPAVASLYEEAFGTTTDLQSLDISDTIGMLRSNSFSERALAQALKEEERQGRYSDPVLLDYLQERYPGLRLSRSASGWYQELYRRLAPNPVADPPSQFEVGIPDTGYQLVVRFPFRGGTGDRVSLLLSHKTGVSEAVWALDWRPWQTCLSVGGSYHSHQMRPIVRGFWKLLHEATNGLISEDLLASKSIWVNCWEPQQWTEWPAMVLSHFGVLKGGSYPPTGEGENG